jgi:hypothetical protein
VEMVSKTSAVEEFTKLLKLFKSKKLHVGR